MGLLKYKTIIKNPWAVWNEPEDLGPYDDTIAVTDTTLAQSKKERTHSQKKEEYEKYLRVMESTQTLILQAVDKPYLEALKEEYIGYDGILPTTMIHHLRSKINKVINKDKATVKQEIFIPWEQPTVLSAYFKKIETAKKKLKKLNVTVLENNIDSNWFTEEHMTAWEEQEDRNKSLGTCKMHFKWC